MSGLKILVGIAVVILLIFGALLGLLFVTGGSGGSRIRSSASPTAGAATRSIPTAIVPTPASGRPDCQSNWGAYGDPDGYFSVCYPSNWKAVSNAAGAGLGTAVTLQSDGYAMLTLYWKPSSFFESPDDDRCTLAPAWDEATQVPLEIAGQTAVACTGYETVHSEGAPPLRSTFAEVPLGPGKGFVVLFFTVPEGSAYSTEADTASTVLQSVQLARR